VKHVVSDALFYVLIYGTNMKKYNKNK